MSSLLIWSLATFFAGLGFAFVVGGWREALAPVGGAGPVAAPDGPAPVFVSMVVPARDAAGTIVPLLQDLHAQRWPRERMEVIVVDDGSTDGTAGLVRELGRSWPSLRLLPATGEGKKAAITQGVGAAYGTWILLTDADARCGPSRVPLMMEAVRALQADMLLMPVATWGTGWLGRLQMEEQAALQGVAAGTAAQGRPVLANGANMAFSKETFRAVGGYDGDTWASGDDLFLLKRMEAHGRRVAFLPVADAGVDVQAEPTLGGFWSQRLRWAGKMRAVGGVATWLSLPGILLPWLLLYVSCSITLPGLMQQRPLAILFLLAGSWLLWLLPVVSLVRASGRFWQGEGRKPGRPAVGTLLALAAFSVYAPLVAATALVVRPRWKGRRV